MDESEFLPLDMPPAAVAGIIEKLVYDDLEGTEIIFDGVLDENAIYVSLPLVTPKNGFILAEIRGNLFTWDGKVYKPDGMMVEILRFEIYPFGQSRSKISCDLLIGPKEFQDMIVGKLKEICGSPGNIGETRKPDQSLEAQEPKFEPEGPWVESRPNYRERDEAIWKMRNDKHTWSSIAEALDIGETTAKENYKRMLARMKIRPKSA